MSKLLYEEETYKIIGACMKVHKVLGAGFLESVYQEALEKEFTKLDIPFIRHQKLNIIFDGQKLKKYFVADFVCYKKIIVELKAISFLRQDDEKQLLNYLKATSFEIGLLINFGQSSLTWKRLINTPSV